MLCNHKSIGLTMPLPTEILMNIFSHIMIEEHNKLFLCVLVNKTWCCIATPYLWQRPFSWIRRPLPIKKGERFLRIFDVMYHFLQDNEKEGLTLDGYRPVSSLMNPSFPYPSYIREITNMGLNFSLDFWQRTYTFREIISDTRYCIPWDHLCILVGRKIKKKDLVLPFCRMFKQENRIHSAILFMNPSFSHDVSECMKCLPV